MSAKTFRYGSIVAAVSYSSGGFWELFGFRRNRLPVIFRIQFPAQNVGHRPIRAARIAIGPNPIASYRNRSGHFCGGTATVTVTAAVVQTHGIAAITSGDARHSGQAKRRSVRRRWRVSCCWSTGLERWKSGAVVNDFGPRIGISLDVEFSPQTIL